MKRNKHILGISVILLAISFLCLSFTSADFIEQQKMYERVQTAFNEKEASIRSDLSALGLNPDSINILITVYKNEKTVNIYAKPLHRDSTYKKVKSYTACYVSEGYGYRKKGKKGSMQLPEGFYHINSFNPIGLSYLSLGISYPNKADLVTNENLNSDVFIKGSCETNTALSMSEGDIKEIYLYAVYANNNKQTQIPVYIYPYEMSDEKHKAFKNQYEKNEILVDFWDKMKKGYDKFERTQRELIWSANRKGGYSFR